MRNYSPAAGCFAHSVRFLIHFGHITDAQYKQNETGILSEEHWAKETFYHSCVCDSLLYQGSSVDVYFFIILSFKDVGFQSRQWVNTAKVNTRDRYKLVGQIWWNIERETLEGLSENFLYFFLLIFT